MTYTELNRIKKKRNILNRFNLYYRCRLMLHRYIIFTNTNQKIQRNRVCVSANLKICRYRRFLNKMFSCIISKLNKSYFVREKKTEYNVSIN